MNPSFAVHHVSGKLFPLQDHISIRLSQDQPEEYENDAQYCSEMKIVFVFILVICIIGLVTGNPYSGDKYYDRDVVRQMAKWLIQAVQNCDLALCNLSPHKRNSEIITSILGLPKNLNDAGRK